METIAFVILVLIVFASNYIVYRMAKNHAKREMLEEIHNCLGDDVIGATPEQLEGMLDNILEMINCECGKMSDR